MEDQPAKTIRYFGLKPTDNRQPQQSCLTQASQALPIVPGSLPASWALPGSPNRQLSAEKSDFVSALKPALRLPRSLRALPLSTAQLHATGAKQALLGGTNDPSSKRKHDSTQDHCPTVAYCTPTSFPLTMHVPFLQLQHTEPPSTPALCDFYQSQTYCCPAPVLNTSHARNTAPTCTCSVQIHEP